MARRELPNFIWFPQTKNYLSSITINGQTVTSNVINAKFTRSIVGEDMGCEILLQNSGEIYTGAFIEGQIIRFIMDFSDGTLVQWEGKIDSIKKVVDSGGFNLNIIGSHYTADLLDITVTEEFENVNISTVLTSIITEYLPTFTSANVETINVTIGKITWKNKPFFDCVIDLMKLGNADCYVDNDKDFHFFVKNSKHNDYEAIVWKDTLMDIKDLGQDSVDVRNKVIINGEAGGLPVLYTSEDTSSQSTYGIKERVITDTSIITMEQAAEISDADKEELKSPPFKGSVDALYMPLLNPADLIYVVFPPQDLTDEFRLVKYTFNHPMPTIECVFSQDVGISKLFKKRIEASIGNEVITNPYKMKFSYNFTFDDFTNIDEPGSTDIDVINGKLVLESGFSEGNMITIAKEIDTAATSCHLLAIGEGLTDALFYISADGTTPTQLITVNTLTTITTPGTQLKLKVVLNSASVEIDSSALLFK